MKLPPHKDNIKELKFRASKAEVCAMIGTYFCFCQFIYSSMIVSDIFSKDIERGKNPVASIPTEEYSKLLERFYVADVSRSNGTSGQGLYIVKKLLLMMNCTNPIIEIHDHNFMITIDFSPLLIKK